jgi:predicted AAA+ superfamily ATPase
MKTILKRIIADFHQIPLPALTPRELKAPLDLDKIIAVIGPRRAGKTYYLFQLIVELEKRGMPRNRVIYINFEDERIALEGNNDLIFDAYRELYPDHKLRDIFIFFDEIQELPGWEKFVRRVSDTVSRHVFITGSNAKLLSKEIGTALRGRSLSFEILTLSFREYLGFNGISADDVFSGQNRALIGRAFETYCLWGGFPELVAVEDRFKAQILQEYFNVMLYRDLVERYAIKDTAILKYLIKRLVASFTGEFSVNKLYNDIRSLGFAAGKDTIYRMVDGIFSVYLAASLEKYDPSVLRREMSNKKVYLYDTGFASALQYPFSEDRGKRLENVVFRHLRAQGGELFFVRNGWECDFVLFPQGERPTLVQVTERLDHNNIDREIKGLTGARKLTGEADVLLLVETAGKGLKIPSWIKVIPVQEWLLSRGRP